MGIFENWDTLETEADDEEAGEVAAAADEEADETIDDRADLDMAANEGADTNDKAEADDEKAAADEEVVVDVREEGTDTDDEDDVWAAAGNGLHRWCWIFDENRHRPHCLHFGKCKSCWCAEAADEEEACAEAADEEEEEEEDKEELAVSARESGRPANV